MRALVQRVSRADVTVGGERIAEIGPGLLVLVCAMAGDEAAAGTGAAHGSASTPPSPWRDQSSSRVVAPSVSGSSG